MTYGGALSYRFSEQATVRFEFAADTAFMDSMDIVGPKDRITLEGETMTSFRFLAGVRYAF